MAFRLMDSSLSACGKLFRKGVQASFGRGDYLSLSLAEPIRERVDMKSLPEITQQVSDDEDVTTINATLFGTCSENQQHFPSTELD